MRKLKKLGAVVSVLLSILMILPTSYTTRALAEENASNNQTINSNKSVRLQDDFYDAINSNWLNTAKIEEGDSTTSTFDDVEKQVSGQIKTIINDLISNRNNYNSNSDEKKIINLYNNTLNINARNNEGIKPVKKILDKIKSAKTIDDVTSLWSDQRVLNSTIQFSVEKDIKNVTTNILYINDTALSLGDPDEYTNPTYISLNTRKLTEDYYNKLFVLSGYTSDEATEKVDDVFKFEGMIAPYMLGKSEKSSAANLVDMAYNVYTLEQLNDIAPNLKISTIMSNLGIDKAKKIILEDPKWLKAFNEIYTEENLPIIKNYLELVNLINASNYLSEDFENVNREFNETLLGIKGNISKEDEAIDNVNSVMGFAIGKIYAEKYVSAKTKEDIENITKQIVEVYKKRINNLDWMSESTKKNAIDKLDKLTIKIGYPENWLDYSNVDIKSYEDGGSLFDNVLSLTVFMQEKMFSKINKQVDKSRYVFKPQTVNAFYSPTDNSITIPGGILQGHFYDVNASKETNLGGIGVVIGHEISHAFDNTGAQYDSAGNLNDWWTTEDYKEFTEKIQKVIDFYNKAEVGQGKKLDGSITVGENIADIGGVSCILDILDTMDKPNYKSFFESYAVTWRQLTTKEYEEYALMIDTHSPNKIRVNAVLPQFQKFYDTYGVTEKDGMYVKPSDRIGIW